MKPADRTLDFSIECVILWRNTQNNRIGFISDGDSDEIAVFPNRAAAQALADDHHLLRAFPYQIIEVDEL